MKRYVIMECILIPSILVLSACGGGGSNTASSGMQRVQIYETDFKIASSITSFSPGISYHFEVTNNGQASHEFMIMPFGMSVSDMPMGDMDKQAFARVENIDPKQTATLNYTFPSNTQGSHPQFACYYPGHYEAGMKLNVTVSS